jgi:chromosome condensin MukBEF ATPase and DNA-binding subunit MukB
MENADLNAKELISALNSIEMETVNVEMEYLRQENARLREDLVKRHQIRLLEIQQMEAKQLELQQKMNEIHHDQSEIFRLRSIMINVNHDLDQALDLLFQLSYGYVSASNMHLTMANLNSLNQQIRNASKRLGFHTIPIENAGDTLELSKLIENKTVEKDMKTLLKEIKSYDFGNVSIV